MHMANILIVDDTPANLSVLTTMLQQYGYKVRPAISGDVAITAVNREKPDLILLDITMPGKNGYEVCEILKSSPDTRDIPIIFISALDAIDDKMKAFHVGGVDYITKPFHVEEVQARVNAHLQLQEQRRRIEELVTFKDEMMRVVSHDLKNPIGLILGYAEMMLEDEETDLNSLKKIHRGASTMLNLVTDLLDVARTESHLPLDLQPENLLSVLKECIAYFEYASSQKNISLTLDESQNNVIVHVDRPRLVQVLSNLMGNAIKYTPENGQVAVSIELLSENGVRVHVRDNGLGIPAQDVPHIFEKFYRVQAESHRKNEGTGLGLAIAHGIMEKHNGSIGVVSELGQGSDFYIDLPV
jgi:two-component system, sensor histidine kinase and response regulator